MSTTPRIVNNLTSTTFTTNETTSNQPLPDYSAFLVVCEVLNAIVFGALVWILISTIIYGTRTKKWKRSGPSSMNSGMIYSACVGVIALSIPRLILNAVIFHIHNIKGGLDWCEFVFDASDVTGYATLYPIYFFLWLRHRVIYSHPSVHALTGRVVNAISWITIVGLTIMSIGVLLFLVIPSSYLATPQGCILDPTTDASLGYYVLAALMIMAQGLLLGLFIYPMVRTNQAQKQSTKLESTDRKSSGISGDLNDASNLGSKFDRLICWKRNVPKKKTNSVTRTIRRSTISAIITVVTDLVVVAAATWIVPSTAPLAATNAIYSVGILINVFCALATFGSNQRILTECCMTCRRRGEKDSSGTGDSSSQQTTNNQLGTRSTAINSASAM